MKRLQIGGESVWCLPGVVSQGTYFLAFFSFFSFFSFFAIAKDPMRRPLVRLRVRPNIKPRLVPSFCEGLHFCSNARESRHVSLDSLHHSLPL